MRVRRIVANIETAEPSAALAFYRDVLGLEVLMDMGWIATLGSQVEHQVQISFMNEGGSGTPVPDVSAEVDDIDEALRRVRQAGIEIAYGPADEPGGVRRFFVRDPLGKLINIVGHR
jgi:catechol 2,3-dioxygenase-like lactoylglutathione lyase family enzyme